MSTLQASRDRGLVHIRLQRARISFRNNVAIPSIGTRPITGAAGEAQQAAELLTCFEQDMFRRVVARDEEKLKILKSSVTCVVFVYFIQVLLSPCFLPC